MFINVKLDENNNPILEPVLSDHLVIDINSFNPAEKIRYNACVEELLQNPNSLGCGFDLDRPEDLEIFKRVVEGDTVTTWYNKK